MAEEIKWVKSDTSPDLWICPYVDGVRCKTRQCERCGWNPEVSSERLRRYRKTGVAIVHPAPLDDMDGEYLPGLLDENI